MAFTCGFFNSIGHDRKYDARQFNSIFNGLITDGVYQNYMNEFRVSAAEADNFITVDTGRAWFNDTWNLNDAPENYELPISDSAKDRIDAVVIEVNTDRAVRDNDIKIIPGVPAEAPQKPTLTNTETVHQYPLAYITRKAGINKVESANIENAVGTAECPYSRLLYPYTPPPSTDPDTPEEPSILDQHIVYDSSSDSLNFLAATLLQNGSPLSAGGGGSSSGSSGSRLEPVVLYNNTGYGANLPITLAESNLDFEFILVQCQLMAEMGSLSMSYDTWKTTIALPKGDGFRVVCETILEANNSEYAYSCGILAMRLEMVLENNVLDVEDLNVARHSMATAVRPYKVSAQNVSSTDYSISSMARGTYAEIKSTAASAGIGIVTTELANVSANSRITKVIGYRRVE